MRRTHAVPYTTSQDEDGVWCAEAHAGEAGVAFGQGDTRAEAVADLREGLALLLEDVDALPLLVPAGRLEEHDDADAVRISKDVKDGRERVFTHEEVWGDED